MLIYSLLYISSKIKFGKVTFEYCYKKLYVLHFWAKILFQYETFQSCTFSVWNGSVEECSKKIKFFRLECKLMVDVASNGNWIQNSCDKKVINFIWIISEEYLWIN